MRAIAGRVFFIITSVSSSILLAGCGEPPGAEGGEMPPELDVAESALVSGASRVTSGTDGTGEAEAVITVAREPNGQTHTLVTANADDPAHVSYDDGGTPGDFSDDTRTIHEHGSQMVIYHRLGLSGSYTATRIAPPTSGVLWGDPAIASEGPYAFATSLYIPPGRFPPDGAGSTLPIVNTASDEDNGIEPYLAGACIARSLNYGQTWSMTENDCVTDGGHFYDGSSVVINTQGKVFAAFNDVDAGQIDVWRTDSPTGALYQTPDPFPGKDIQTHPRMRIHDGNIFLMAIDGQGRLWLNEYTSSAWQTPILAASNVAFYEPVALANNTTIRQGPGFDLTVYASPVGGGEKVVFVHTALVSGKSVLKVGSCDASSGAWSCALTGAESNSSVDSFNPAIATGWFSPSLGVSVPSTKISYQRLKSTRTTVALYVASVNFNTNVQVSGWQTPCPDARGYWGDYDSMTAASDGFHRVFSDSTGATCVRQEYIESPLGVSEAVIPIQ
jgi:hypothetical protein